MIMQAPVVVLFSNPYAMEENGKKNEGVSVMYLIGDSLAPAQQENGAKGQRPIKVSLPPSKASKFTMVPGLYNGHFEMSVGGNLKAVMKLVDLDFKSEIKLEEVPSNF